MRDLGEVPQFKSATYRAVYAVLRRIQNDAEVRYHISPHTETFELLCKAESEELCKPLEDVRRERSKCLDTRPTRMERMERDYAELQEENERLRRRLRALGEDV